MVQQVKFNQIIQCGCGIDVHQQVIVATIRRSDTEYETRNFEAYTRSLTELREWCKSEGFTHIAMESTGVYWKPVFNILEEDFEIILVNARHVKNVPGHKTDKKDSAISIISEMRVDTSQFPDEQHLSSWTGMSPGSNESAGRKSTRITHGNKYLRSTLVECG